MTYLEYELFVKQHFERQLGQTVTIDHQANMTSPDGEFSIDLSFKHRVAGVDYLTIIECKHSKNPVKRSVVMELDKRKESLKAHKAILVTTTGFQLGAIEYALKNKIGLIKLTTHGEGETLSHYTGNYDPYLKTLLESDSMKENEKLESSIGIIVPSEPVEKYFMRKFSIDIMPVLSNLDEPEKLFVKNYLPNVPLDWRNEYEAAQTSGLNLVLENEDIIRMINSLLRYYHSEEFPRA